MSFTSPPTYPPLLFLLQIVMSVQCRGYIIHNSIVVLELLKREEEELMKVGKRYNEHYNNYFCFMLRCFVICVVGGKKDYLLD